MTALPASAQGPGPTLPGQMGQPPPPPVPDDQKAELIKAATSPTWEDVVSILRSDKLRGYRIDIETDSTTLQDAQADKQSRIEFMGAAKDFLQQAYQAITVAPQLLPVVQEVMMFGVRSFKAGRALEETFEDAFDELSKNPPKPPAGPQQPGPDPVAMAKVDVEKQRLLLDNEQMQRDSAAKANETAAQQTERMQRLQLDAERLAADREKAQSDAQLKNKELDIQAQSKQAELGVKADQGNKDYALRVAEHHKSIVNDAIQRQTDEQSAKGEQAPQGPDPTELIAQLAKAIVQGQETTAQAQRQLAEAVMAAQQAHGQQVMVLATKLSAPKRVVRGPDGRATGVETVG